MRSAFVSLRNFLPLAAAILSYAAIANAQQSAAPATQGAETKQPARTVVRGEVRPKIRTITAFINLDPSQYKQQVAETMQMLRRAKTIFESRGYEVQTLRIATQPFPEYTKGMSTQQAVAFFKEYDALAVKEKFAASIGPAMLNADDSAAQGELLGEILFNTKSLNATLAVAGEDGVRWNAVGAAAKVMKRLEETEHSQGNFRFAAVAMVAPLPPFFPAAYHTGFGHQFAIALESANIVAAAFKDARDLGMARQRLIDALVSTAFDVEHHAGRVDQEPAGRTWESIFRRRLREMFPSAPPLKI